jgi:competence ComEA-like helix-hairpin-helix protein
MTLPSLFFFGDRRLLSAVLMLALMLAVPACVKRSHTTMSSQPEANDQQSPSRTNQRRININTAAANELETLPGIGKGLAERIIEHRERFGPFRRTEHLIIVRGISDRRFRALRDLVTVE